MDVTTNELEAFPGPLCRVNLADGRVLASKRGRSQVYRFGDRMQQRGFLQLPAIVAPGQYRIVVGISGMQQEIALASQPLQVIR